MPEGWRRRQFTAAERDALLINAGGRCCICNVELGTNWHADHIVPFAAGGETDVANGQALCPPCNQAKGAGDFARKRDAQESLDRVANVAGEMTDHVDAATGAHVRVFVGAWTPERARAMKAALEKRIR